MATRMTLAFACYGAAYLVFTAFAAIYLLRPRFMPYHATAVGMRWEDVGRPFQVLILGLMRVFGGALLAAAFIGGVLLAVPFRHGVSWAYWAVPVHGFIVACSSLCGTLYVQAKTQARSPWMAAAAAIVLLIAGAVLSIGPRTSGR